MWANTTPSRIPEKLRHKPAIKLLIIYKINRNWEGGDIYDGAKDIYWIVKNPGMRV